MDIDEAGGDDGTVGIDCLARSAGNAAELGDNPVLDCNVSSEATRASPPAKSRCL
jgi:hypothetical protein